MAAVLVETVGIALLLLLLFAVMVAFDCIALLLADDADRVMVLSDTAVVVTAPIDDTTVVVRNSVVVSVACGCVNVTVSVVGLIETGTPWLLAGRSVMVRVCV